MGRKKTKHIKTKIKKSASVVDLSIPIIIPKRGKGSIETVGKFTIDLYGIDVDFNPIDIVQYIMPYAKSTVSIDIMTDMANDIKHGIGANDIDIMLKFSYFFDKVSPQYRGLVLDIPCQHWFNVSNKTTVHSTSITVPIRIKDIYPVTGRLKLTVNENKNLFLETMLDYVNSAGVKIYPLSSSHDMDKNTLPKDISKVLYDLPDIPTILQKIKTTVEASKHSGFASITIGDIYAIYNMRHTTSW